MHFVFKLFLDELQHVHVGYCSCLNKVVLVCMLLQIVDFHGCCGAHVFSSTTYHCGLPVGM